jgi:GNAT superfamily N-acetyltransferase
MRIFQPSTPEQHRHGLSVLIATPHVTAGDVDAQVEALHSYTRAYNLSLTNLLIAEDRGRAISACLCVDSPGHIASVFLPASLEAPERIRATAEILDHLTEQARVRQVQLLQSMVDPASTVEPQVLSGCGFTRAARLIYLELDLAEPIPSGPSFELSWERFSQERAPEFHRVLAATYESSLDCPALNGRRAMEDVIATHRSAGRFEPSSWLIGRWVNQPTGIVLVNAFPERFTSEVVYMGVMPCFRGRGFGAALLRQAVRLARQQGSTALALSVDELNAPARRLYSGFGLRETMRRDAWIRFLG